MNASGHAPSTYELPAIGRPKARPPLPKVAVEEHFNLLSAAPAGPDTEDLSKLVKAMDYDATWMARIDERLVEIGPMRLAEMDAAGVDVCVLSHTYYHFRTKDELIAAYLASRDQPTLAYYERWFAETKGSTADKVRGLFASFAKSANTPAWRGCGFLRTIAELASTPRHPAIKAGAAHKKRFEAWMADRLARDGVKNAAGIARQIVILLDGAATVMLIHRDIAYVEAAGNVAAGLVTESKLPAPRRLSASRSQGSGSRGRNSL